MPPAEAPLLPDERVKQLARILRSDGVPHAFGGAIALVYWSEPRGTVDIDVNIFLPASDAEHVFTVLSRHGITTSDSLVREAIEREQVRLDWAGTFVDLFFAYDPFHDSCRARAVEVDFYGEPIFVLSAEDIVLFKTLFNRAKDWPDIEQLLAVRGPAFDAEYTRAWIAEMLPRLDSARQRLEGLLAAHQSHDR